MTLLVCLQIYPSIYASIQTWCAKYICCALVLCLYLSLPLSKIPKITLSFYYGETTPCTTQRRHQTSQLRHELSTQKNSFSSVSALHALLVPNRGLFAPPNPAVVVGLAVYFQTLLLNAEHTLLCLPAVFIPFKTMSSLMYCPILVEQCCEIQFMTAWLHASLRDPASDSERIMAKYPGISSAVSFKVLN